MTRLDVYNLFTVPEQELLTAMLTQSLFYNWWPNWMLSENFNNSAYVTSLCQDLVDFSIVDSQARADEIYAAWMTALGA